MKYKTLNLFPSEEYANLTLIKYLQAGYKILSCVFYVYCNAGLSKLQYVLQLQDLKLVKS